MNGINIKVSEVEWSHMERRILISACYPLSESGFLFPLLNDEDLLYRFYTNANKRKEVKLFCKKEVWAGKPKIQHSITESNLKKLILSMCNSVEARKKLKDNPRVLELHQIIWLFLRTENILLFEKVKSFCFQDDKECFYIKPEGLGQLLNSSVESWSQDGFYIVYLVMAFCMLQKDISMQLIKELLIRYPAAISYFSSVSIDGVSVVASEDLVNEAVCSQSSIFSNELISIDQLNIHFEALESAGERFNFHLSSYNENIKKIADSNNVSIFLDGNISNSVFLKIQNDADSIGRIYLDIRDILSMESFENYSDDFLLRWPTFDFSNNSVDDLKRFIDNHKSNVLKIITNVTTARKNIEDLKVKEEQLLLRLESEKEAYIFPENPSLSDFTDMAVKYREYIADLTLFVERDIFERKNPLVLACEQLDIRYGFRDSLTNKSYFLELENIRRMLFDATSMADLSHCQIILEEFSRKCSDLDGESFRILAEKINESHAPSVGMLIKLCRTLIVQKKPEIALFLLYVYENLPNAEGLAENTDLGITVLIEAGFYSVGEEFSIDTIFDIFSCGAWFSNILNEDIGSSELLERLMIIAIGAALGGHVDFSATLLIKINAVELGRNIFPELLNEIIFSVVTRKPVQIAAAEVMDRIRSQEEEIKALIAFENGKYRHIQRNAKHFARFESVIVFPALVDLWAKVSSFVEVKKYSDAYAVVNNLNVNQWYTKLLDSYDKSLVGHHHFSQATINFIEEFLTLIREYLNYSAATFGANHLMISKDKFLESLQTWSGTERTRNKIFKGVSDLLFGKTKPDNNIWRSVLQCRTIVLNCPNAVIWLRKQIVPAGSLELFQLILKDLSVLIDFGTVENSLRQEFAWDLLVTLFHPVDESMSRNFKVLHDEDIEKLSNSRSYVSASTNKTLLDSFDLCLNSGRLPAVRAVILQCELENESLKVAQKERLFLIVEDFLKSLNGIKDLAAESNMSNLWQESVYGLAAKIEMRLRILRKSDGAINLGDFEISKLEVAIFALQSIVETCSHGFEEVEHNLILESDFGDRTPANNVTIANNKCPELLKHWSSLCSVDLIDDIEIKRAWGQFVKEFSKISSLYHDDHDEKKRFGIVPPGLLKYTYPIYQSAFYKPQSEFLKRPLRLYLYRNDVDMPALKRLDEELSSEDSAAKSHLIFVPQGFEKIQKFFKYDKGFRNFILVDDSFLHKICCDDKHGVPVRQALHVSVTDLANSSPFVAQGYCHQSNNIYVGRKDILQKLLNTPQAMIWGGRRIGKTSVLHALENALNNRSYRVAYVYVDIPDDGDPDLAIAKKIASTLGLGDVKNLTDFERKLIKLRNGGAKIAFLIDEVDEYIKKSRKKHENSFPLATLLRQLVMDDPAKDTFLVYSGYHQLYYEAKLDKEKRRVGHPFINIAQQIPIRDLTYDDVEELVKTGFEEMLGISVNPTVPRLIAQRASRHPAFVQQFCRCLLERVSKRRSPGAIVTITTEDVESVYAANVSTEGGEQAFILYVNETLGYNLSHLGRAIMVAITDLNHTDNLSDDAYYLLQKISGRINEWCGVVGVDTPSPEHFQQTIELLVMTNMLTQSPKEHDLYRVTYPTYLDILRRLDKIGRSAIEHSLQAYDEQEREKGILL